MKLSFKCLRWLLSLVWIGVLLAGCRSAQPEEPVTITLASGMGGTRDAILELVQQFDEAHPDINVEVVFLPEHTDEQHDFYVEEMEVESDNIDVVTIDIIWPPEFGAQGWTVPLDEYVEEAGIDMNDFLPGTVDGNTWEGDLVSLPWFIDAGFLYYRKDLLEAYGFEPPETWAELQEIARTIVAGEQATSPELVGFVYQADEYEGLVCNYLEYVWGNGAEVLEQDAEGETKIVLDTPEAVEALEIFASMQEIAPAGIHTFAEDDALNYFRSGNAVFMRNWPYAWAKSNEDDSPIKGKVGMAPLPHGPQGTVGVSTLGGWQVGINAYSQHPDVAFELVSFLTAPEQESYMALEEGQLPTRKSIYRDPEVLKINPYMEEFYNVFTNARPRPVHPAYAKGISPIIQEEAYSVLLGEKDAAAATAAMARRIQQVIDEY